MSISLCPEQHPQRIIDVVKSTTSSSVLLLRDILKDIELAQERVIRHIRPNMPAGIAKD